MNDPPRRPTLAALVAGIALAGFVLGGCLAYESAEYRFHVDPKTRMVHAHVTYRHFESDDSTAAGRRTDFEELVRDVTGDEQLLESARHKLYMRNRRLFLENGVVNGSYDVLAEDLEALGGDLPPTLVFGDSSVYVLDSADSVLGTNGFHRTWSETLLSAPGDTIFPQQPDRDPAHELRLVVWPKGADPMWVRVHMVDLRGRSGFAALYRDWVRRGRPASGTATAPTAAR